MFVMVMNRNSSKPRISYVNAERVEQMVEDLTNVDSEGEAMWRVQMATGHLLVDAKDMERLLEALGDLDELREGREYSPTFKLTPEANAKATDKAG